MQDSLDATITVTIIPTPIGGDTAEIVSIAPQIIKVNVPTEVTLTYIDPGEAEAHLVNILWGDGTRSPVSGDLLVLPNGFEQRTATFTHTFTTVEVFRLTAEVLTASSIPTFDEQDFLISVYDPDAGFITGGGTFDSPLDAFDFTEFPGGVLTPLSAEPNFGFNAKYEAGATTPKGNTNFVYDDGVNFNMHLKSISYTVLITENIQATYRGTGNLFLNGIMVGAVGQWDFLVVGKDGNSNPDGTENKKGIDRVRVKIWDNTVPGQPTDGAIFGVIFDNERGSPEDDPAQGKVISGSIVIHDPSQGQGKGGGKGGGDGPGTCPGSKVWDESKQKCVKSK